ncbi:hypothetical protein VEE32_22810 [Escherichia coli]|nr:hypothetical protein VEE32_22810 [Escherichia coli]
MNQTVAVTGATGFIGKYIIDNLLARGFHVRALTRTARAHVNDNLTWVRGSLEDTHSLSELVAGASVSGPLRRASARAQRRDFHPL